MSQLAGTKPMTIGGRVMNERERMLGMTDFERAWRKQWLQDQILAPHEPVYVQAYWDERINPIRRFYRKPLDVIFNKLSPVLGYDRAMHLRYFTGKFIMIGFGVLAVHYYFKYNGNDWTKKGGWRVMKSRQSVTPGQEGYPKLSERTKPSDYANRGFDKSPL